MGISFHGLAFLKYAANSAPLGRTITLGRQALHVDNDLAERLVGPIGQPEKYCERLLRENLGATEVDSLDYSDFEQASIIHDMNQPVSESLHKQYDLVVDSGTLEHVFDIRQAFMNCGSLTKVGGRILHMSPANCYCGHGFYQFSPELFYSVYSEGNGFTDTQVFLVNMMQSAAWHKVPKPADGGRMVVRSERGMYAHAYTRRKSEKIFEAGVFQSDYVHRWTESGEGSSDDGRGMREGAQPRGQLTQVSIADLLGSRK